MPKAMTILGSKTPTNDAVLSAVPQWPSVRSPALVLHIVCVKHGGSKPVLSSVRGLCLCTVVIRIRLTWAFYPSERV